MALKCVLESTDNVPEALQSEYVEKDGKLYLQLDGVREHPEVQSLKNAFERVKKERETASGELLALKEKVGEFPDDFDPDEYRRLKEAGEKGVKIDERIEKVKTELQKRHEAEIKQKEDRLKLVESALRTTKVDDGLTNALLEAGIDRKHLPIVKSYLSSKVQIDESDGKFEPYIEGDLETRLSLTDFARAWANNDVGKNYVAPATGGGATGGNGAITGENPWAKGQENLTKQDALVRDNPARARQLASAAGIKPDW